MAEKKGERRMLFDTRGRRRNVIRVVYAVLALLMGGSLFLTVGPFNIGELVGGSTSTEASEIFEEQSERIEGRLAQDPDDENLLLALTRARINTANAKIGSNPETGTIEVPPPDAQKEFSRALEAWNRYLNLAGDDANPGAAQLVAQTYFGLAERGSTSFSDVQENLAVAVRAQRISAAARPNVGSLSSLAIYEYFNGNFEAGDEATKQAKARATKPEAKEIDKQLGEFRQRAKRYARQSEQAAKEERESGAEQLQSPFGGFGAGVPGG